MQNFQACRQLRLHRRVGSLENVPLLPDSRNQDSRSYLPPGETFPVSLS